MKAPVPGGVTHILALTDTESYFDEIFAVLAPQGALALTDPSGPLDISKLKQKSVSIQWEQVQPLVFPDGRP